MTSSTRFRSFSRTGAVPLTTCDTVPMETCALSAICFIVVGLVIESESAMFRLPLLFCESLFVRQDGETSATHCASCAQRNPNAPERSMLADIIKSLPCSVNLYAWGKYQMEPCGR